MSSGRGMYTLPADQGVLAEAYEHLRQGASPLYDYHVRELLRDLDRRLSALERPPDEPHWLRES